MAQTNKRPVARLRFDVNFPIMISPVTLNATTRLQTLSAPSHCGPGRVRVVGVGLRDKREVSLSSAWQMSRRDDNSSKRPEQADPETRQANCNAIPIAPLRMDLAIDSLGEMSDRVQSGPWGHSTTIFTSSPGLSLSVAASPLITRNRSRFLSVTRLIAFQSLVFRYTS